MEAATYMAMYHRHSIWCHTYWEHLLFCFLNCQIASFTGVVTTHYDNYEFYKGVDCIMAQLRQTNGFMESVRPWELRNDIEVLNVVLHIIMENLRVCSILLQVIAVNIRFIVISL